MFDNNKLLLGINNIPQWLKGTMPLSILCQVGRNETTPESPVSISCPTFYS